MKSFVFRLLWAFLPILTIPAMAAPGWMNYQGRLTNPAGQPITTPFNIIFTFWSAATGGVQLGAFSDTDTVTADANGIYSTLVGDDPGNLIPASIFTGDSVWLNVRINGQDLTPRKQVVSVGYALRAAQADDADKVDGQHAAAFMPAAADNWVNTSGDTMTGALTVTGSSSPALVNVTNSNTGTVRAIQGTASGTGAVGNNGGRFEAAGDWGSGVYGQATGATGYGVFGYASANGATTNTGGYFEAAGDSGQGVEGMAPATGDVTNYGGRFYARGNSGHGVSGDANATGDVANYGGSFSAAGNWGSGVSGTASGTAGHGVKGSATAPGAAINYGGYFSAAGDNGHGVGGIASGTSGHGVSGWATALGGVTNYGGYFSAAGKYGRGVYGAANAPGNGSAYGGYFEAAGDYGRGVYGTTGGFAGAAVEGVATATDNSTNYGGSFFAAGKKGYGVAAMAPGTQGIAVYAVGEAYNFYAGGIGINYFPFTGAHEVQFAAGFPDGPQPGLIVATAGPSQIRRDKTGQVSISSTLPTVRLADRPNDKAVFGVLVSEMPLPEGHWYQPAAGERFGAVNALGEGRVWVCSAAGPIQMGDYITTSAVPGYGQNQHDDTPRAWTVGKVIESVDWDAVTDTIEHDGQIYKVVLIAVVYTCG